MAPVVPKRYSGLRSTAILLCSIQNQSTLFWRSSQALPTLHRILILLQPLAAEAAGRSGRSRQDRHKHSHHGRIHRTFGVPNCHRSVRVNRQASCGCTCCWLCANTSPIYSQPQICLCVLVALARPRFRCTTRTSSFVVLAHSPIALAHSPITLAHSAYPSLATNVSFRPSQ